MYHMYFQFLGFPSAIPSIAVARRFVRVDSVLASVKNRLVRCGRPPNSREVPGCIDVGSGASGQNSSDRLAVIDLETLPSGDVETVRIQAKEMK